MSEFTPDALSEHDARLGINYLTARNVRARFMLYEMGEPFVDMENKAIEALGLNGTETMVDIGAADGSFLRKLRVEYGHEGRLIGVEPNATQYKSEPIWQPVDPELITQSIQQQLGKSALESKDIEHMITEGLPRLGNNRLELMRGRADDIPLLSNKADIVTAMFMMYHVPRKDLRPSFEEIKRVLKPDGSFLLATSGARNKSRHRVFEKHIANSLGIRAPKPMNSGFTTEKATTILPRYFNHVYAYNYAAKMLIKDQLGMAAYINSIYSLHDQFDPVPSRADFDSAVQSLVVPKIEQAMQSRGSFVDTIERSIFISSNEAKHIATGGFSLLPRSA